MLNIKLVLIGIMFALLSGCASSPEPAQQSQGNHNWILVSENTTATFYLDTNEIAQGEDRVAFLTKVKFFDKQTTAGIDYWSSNVMFLVLTNKNQYGLYETHLYDKSGNQVHHSPPDENMEFSPIKNGAPVQKLYKEALKYL